MKEIWKPVFYGRYQVSTAGRVKRVKPYRNQCVDGVLKQQRLSNGYRMVTLCRLSQQRPRLVHRLVAEAFIGPAVGKHVNHLNGIKHDNRLCNLEFVTPKENAQHASRIGLLPVGARHWKSKLTAANVQAIRAQYRFGNGQKLARKFGVHVSMIHYIVRRKCWKHL